jgi:hypothetical protein
MTPKSITFGNRIMRLRQITLVVIISVLTALPVFAASKEETRVADATDLTPPTLSISC